MSKHICPFCGDVIVCPDCGGWDNLRILDHDGGFECLNCQTDEHESWFWCECDLDLGAPA